jgi:hypothetical protein
MIQQPRQPILPVVSPSSVVASPLKVAGFNLYAIPGNESFAVIGSTPEHADGPLPYKIQLRSGNYAFSQRHKVEAPLSDAQTQFLAHPELEAFALDADSVVQIERRFSDGSVAAAPFADPRSPILGREYGIFESTLACNGKIHLRRELTACFLHLNVPYYVSSAGLNFHRVELPKVMEITESQFLRLLPLSKDYSPDMEPRYA